MSRRLYDGTRFTGLTVQPDPDWPAMWRIHYPDGTVSDMVNISRATDAAWAWAARNFGSHNKRRLHWGRPKSAPEPATADKSPRRPGDLPHG